MGGAAAAAKNCVSEGGEARGSRVQRSGRYQPRECFSYQYHGHEYATALAHLEPGAALALDLERRAKQHSPTCDDEMPHTHAIADPATHARARRDVLLSYLHI